MKRGFVVMAFALMANGCLSFSSGVLSQDAASGEVEWPLKDKKATRVRMAERFALMRQHAPRVTPLVERLKALIARNEAAPAAFAAQTRGLDVATLERCGDSWFRFREEQAALSAEIETVAFPSEPLVEELTAPYQNWQKTLPLLEEAFAKADADLTHAETSASALEATLASFTSCTHP